MEHTDNASAARRRAPLLNDNPFKLCLFGFNLSGGQTISTAPGVLDPTWEENARLARISDRAGLEALIPVGRWIGFGGPSRYHQKSFEPYTWAAGLGALTEYSMVTATGHVPSTHPIVAAKQSVTVDHITGGRFALNLVSGWFITEMEFFGAKMLGHDERYEQAAEWLELCKRLWRDEGEFDFAGDFYTLKNASSTPGPVQQPHPVVISAGVSPRGRRFAAEHADVAFITGETIADLGKNAAAFRRMAREEFGRDIVVLSDIVACCFPTDREARAYAKQVGDMGDTVAAGNNVAIMKAHTQTWTEEQYARFQRHFMQSYGAPQALGSPERVARFLVDLHAEGVDGTAFSFMGHWEENLRLFADEVLPRLEEAGIRRPHPERLAELRETAGTPQGDGHSGSLDPVSEESHAK